MSLSGTVRTFALSDSFIADYKNKQPEWGYNGLGYVVYKRTYSREKEDGKLEEFWETCRRVVEATYDIQKKHCKQLRLPWDDRKAQKSAQEMFRRMWEFKWLPPGRGMWMMGTPTIEKLGGAALCNCAFISTKEIAIDFAEPFCWMMDMLMLGLGVGFDTRGAGLVKIQQPTYSHSYIVEDSREGWVKLVRIVLNAYIGKDSVPSNVDYSQIRPAGAPIKGFGGTSSGPGPLKELIVSLQDILDKKIGQKIDSTTIVDIGNLIGRCVVSGNIRRSAEIAFGDIKDDEFLNLKNPEINKKELMNHRWASNNSIFANVGMDYSKVSGMIQKNGEPGLLWLENARSFSRMDEHPNDVDKLTDGANPCVEQQLHNGEICNLVETFPEKHDSYEDFEKTLKCAYLYAKTVTLVPTHSARTNMVVMKNRRIGCSMSGIVQAIQKFGRRKFLSTFCDQGYAYLQQLDKSYSDWLCVRTSIKTTSVKPSGTISLLVGATPGIHFPHAKHYLRRVRLQENSPLVKTLYVAGYPIEKDKYSPSTVVATFPVEERNFDRSKDDVTMWEQLEFAAQMQRYWADNQVSVTVTFKPEEAKDIKYALELYETRLKGVSFLPLQNHGYEQAPYETCTEEKYKELMQNITPLNAEMLIHENDSKYCDGEYCVV